MGILNWRNALVGWAAVKVGKRVIKSKAKAAVPGRKESGSRFGLSAIAWGAAAAAGVAWLVMRRRRHGSSSPGE